MVSQHYAAPLVIEVRPTRRVRQVTVATLLLAGVAIALAGLPPAVRIGMAALLLLYAARVWRRPELGGPAGRLVWDAADEWWWEAGDERLGLTLCGDSVVTPLVTLLTFRTVDRGVRSIVLLPGSADAELLRRLRVRLRLAAKAAAAAATAAK